jgi:mannan endo-1,4-beta-mannosidase
MLDGLDIILDEMGKRNLKAIVFFSNNWEWSGGFQQYLTWNDLVPKDKLTRRLTWDELRDLVSKFYGCEPCKKAYNEQVKLVMDRTNKINNKKYTEDPTIMAWELANEPRPMRPYANDDYKKWIADVAAMIKTKDKNHLIAIGHEGSIGTESLDLFKEIHDDKNVDYLTIHIWPRNWSWYERPNIKEGFSGVLENTKIYIEEHIAIAKMQNKPIVIEEFGFPRDGEAFDAVTSTSFRDRYFEFIFSYLPDGKSSQGSLNGVNFWAFGGSARPIKNQLFWKSGDDYMGDPPMEEQGLYSVFDRDKSTWKVIKKHAKKLK